MSFFIPYLVHLHWTNYVFLYKDAVQADFVTLEDSLHLTVEHVLKF